MWWRGKEDADGEGEELKVAGSDQVGIKFAVSKQLEGNGQQEKRHTEPYILHE